MTDQSLANALESIGFDEKESKVYLALLELGSGTATQIAEKSGLKRAIIYHVIDRLKAQGYAQDMPEEGVKKFSVTDPSRVLQNVRTAVEDFKYMIPVMRALQNKPGNMPRMEFFEGKDAVLSIYRELFQGKSMRYLSSMKHMLSALPQESEAFIDRVRKGLISDNGKHLLGDTREDREWGSKIIDAGHKVRVLPKDMSFEMDFGIVDDVLAITSFDPFFVVVIRSETVAKSSAQLFDLAWMQGKELK